MTFNLISAAPARLRIVVATAFVAMALAFSVSQAAPARAASATYFTFEGLNKNVTANTDDAFTITARDDDDAVDGGYAGEVEFLAEDGCDQGPCFEIRETEGGAPVETTTFAAGNHGSKQLFLRWKTPGTHDFAAGGPDAADPEGLVLGVEEGIVVSAASTTNTTAAPATGATTTTTAPVANCTDPAKSTARVSKSTLAPGESVTLRGECFAPNAVLTVSILSTPVVIGQTTADASGQFATILNIPTKTAPGAHTLSVTGPGGKGVAHTASVAITVTGSTTTAAPKIARLPRTGSMTGKIALVGALLLALGVAMRSSRGRKPSGSHYSAL